MTNAEIITESMLLNGLDPMKVVVDTFAGWKRKGFRVKKGEKAVFTTAIWKPSKRKAKDDEVEKEETDGTGRTAMYLVNAAFFTSEQVEKTEEKENGKVLS